MMMIFRPPEGHTTTITTSTYARDYSRTITATCSCGWAAAPSGNLRQAEDLAHAHLASVSPTPGVGTFTATCRLWYSRRLTALSPEERSRAALITYGPNKGGFLTQWDRKTGAEIAQVQCDFATNDRADFEVHMAQVHGRKSSRLRVWAGYGAERAITGTLPAKGWTETGKPWRDTVSGGKPRKGYYARQNRTWQCGCGLVVETSYDDSLKDEHQAECAGIEAAS